MYDPAFYHTPEEVGGKEVQTRIERPETHILGCSGSSLLDQALVSNCPLECTQELSTLLHTATGIHCIFFMVMAQHSRTKLVIVLVAHIHVCSVEWHQMKLVNLNVPIDAKQGA